MPFGPSEGLLPGMAKKKSANGDEAGEGVIVPAKPYVVLARKYRPSTFDDLIGQEAMVKTLTNAFASGRIAQGYMLTGVRGVGKTTTARIIARALNYETDTIDQPAIAMKALGRHCAEIIESRHPDVIEMDAASNTGVDNMREIIESARYKPILARTKVFIIDEVHMLSKGAFNALLKTLEEPPEHVKFIFATTEIRKVPVTVLSRCQRFDLRRVDVPELSQHFKRIVDKEGASAEDDALALIARAAGGSVRDGLSILDQAIATGSGNVTAPSVRAMLGLADRGRIFDLLDALLAGTPAAALEQFAGLHRDGAEPQQVLSDLAETVHLVTRFKAIGGQAGSEGLSGEDIRRADHLGKRLSVAILTRAWQMLIKGLEEINKAPDPVAAVDMVLIRIAYTADLPPPDEIIRALGGENIAVRRGVPLPAAERDRGATINAAPDDATVLAADDEQDIFGPPADVIPDAFDADPQTDAGLDAAVEGPIEGPIEGLGDEDDQPVATGNIPPLRPLQSYADVVALTGDRRDAKLKYHLEEHVSLVAFDGAVGSIDLFLLPGAPPEIANELREKLNKWTGRRWVVVLSKAKGKPPIGEVRRARDAAELAEVARDPAIAAVLDAFPGAKIAAVSPRDDETDEKTGTG